MYYQKIKARLSPCKTLWVVTCPICSKVHWHSAATFGRTSALCGAQNEYEIPDATLDK